MKCQKCKKRNVNEIWGKFCDTCLPDFKKWMKKNHPQKYREMVEEAKEEAKNDPLTKAIDVMIGHHDIL